MKTEINLTELEKKVLIGINNSNYGQEPGDQIWSWSIECDIAGTKQISGVVSSLSKKGLVGNHDAGEDSTIWLTPKGIDVCKQNNLLGQYSN